jgi:NADPH-dependent curcumin reductase CurA
VTLTTDLTNTRILLRSRPVGEPTPDDFELAHEPAASPGEGEVLVRTHYLSLDPYMRGRMSAAKSYAAPTELGAVLPGGTVGEVVESRDPSLSPGDLVLAGGGWQAYAVVPAKAVRRLDPALAPPSTALGVLGMPGFTAYAGLTVLGRPKAGETVVVAAATGPVGATVGQIAKILGCRAVGIAGGPEKVAHMEELGFDAAIDHRAPDFVDQLAAATGPVGATPRPTASTSTSRTSAAWCGTPSCHGSTSTRGCRSAAWSRTTTTPSCRPVPTAASR